MSLHTKKFFLFIANVFQSNGRPLKFLDQFIYLSSNMSSTESYVEICIDKAQTFIDKLSSYEYLT